MDDSKVIQIWPDFCHFHDYSETVGCCLYPIEARCYGSLKSFKFGQIFVIFVITQKGFIMYCFTCVMCEVEEAKNPEDKTHTFHVVLL